MKCSEAHELIGELLEGTIREEDRRTLEKHLESCPDCRELLADFQEIKTQAAALPKLEPSSTVWPNVLDAVRRDRRARSARPAATLNWRDRFFAPGLPRYAFVAALTVCLVVGGIVLIREPRKSPVPITPAGNGAGAEYTMAKLQEAEIHYRLAIRALSEAAAAQETGLDPVTTEALAKDLRTIDAVIESCREAVRHDPKSVEARVYLLGAYKGKLEFLDTVITAKKKTADPARAGIVL